MRQIRVTYHGVPDPKLRGNKRGNWKGAEGLVKQDKNRGLLLGKDLLASGYKPLRGLMEIQIDAVIPRDIDGDNLLIGYKPFIDGLVRSGIMPDDKFIKDWELHIATGRPPLARIQITERRQRD